MSAGRYGRPDYGSNPLRAVGATLVLLTLPVGVLLAPIESPVTHPHPALGTIPAVKALGSSPTGVSPPALLSASGTFDAADGYVLLFGGLTDSGAVSAATWAFTRGNWSPLPVVGGVAPPGRFQAQMAYDSRDAYVVLFGGCADAGCRQVLDDTWTFSHGAWAQVATPPNATPPARDLGGMVADPADGGVFLFSGEQTNRSLFLADAWTFRAGAWSAATPLNSSAPVPPAREGVSMAFDPATNETVLFGGRSAVAVLADTWTYRARTWTNLTASIPAGPSPRWSTAAAYDTQARFVLLVNGYSHGTSFQDTWGFDGTKWIALADAAGPDAGYGGLLVDDPVDGYAVFFSGAVAGGSWYTPTFLYTSTGWTLWINPPGSSPFSLVGVIFPLILLPVLFLVMVPIGNFVRRRREARLAQGVVIRPGEYVRWVDSPRDARFAAVQFAPAAALLAIPAIFLGTLASVGVSLSTLLVLGGIAAIAYGASSVMLYLAVSRQLTLSVGIAAGGVIVRRKAGELRIAWDSIQPSVFRPNRGRYFFQYLFPDRQAGAGGFSVTVDQARAIFTDPRSPPWVVPRQVSDGLNLPPRSPPLPGSSVATAPASTVRPSTPPSPEPTYYSPPSATATSFQYPPPPPPRPGWGSVPSRYSAAPGGTSPGARPYSAAAVAPPPGTVACRTCGQLNPSRGVVFCRNCGNRLG